MDMLKNPMYELIIKTRSLFDYNYIFWDTQPNKIYERALEVLTSHCNESIFMTQVDVLVNKFQRKGSEGSGRTEELVLVDKEHVHYKDTDKFEIFDDNFFHGDKAFPWCTEIKALDDSVYELYCSYDDISDLLLEMSYDTFILRERIREEIAKSIIYNDPTTVTFSVKKIKAIGGERELVRTFKISKKEFKKKKNALKGLGKFMRGGHPI